MRRHIHYEAAFEDYLRSQGSAYIAVDETRKAIFAGSKVKSFDFLVYRKLEANWLVDVKGRKFPYEVRGRRRYWENWVTQEDLADMREWEQVFGTGFEAVLVFAYWLTGPSEKWPIQQVHPFRGEYYAFQALSVSQYKSQCVARSPKWQTVTVPVKKFRALARAC